MKLERLATTIGVLLLAFAAPYTAGATVKKEGTWPATEKRVDLEFDGAPSDGLQALAKEAGWSLVVQNGAAIDREASNVHVAVEGEPADAVLEALFVGRDVVAHRTGRLITVTPMGVVPPVLPVPPVPAIPPPVVHGRGHAPPIPTIRGEDRDVVGSNLVIGKNEIVHDVTVTGGTVEIEGTVTGDLAVAGGSATVRRGARIIGNATVFGGVLHLENGSRLDGDIGIAGGALDRDDDAVVGGRISNSGDATAHPRRHRPSAEQHVGRSRVVDAFRTFGRSITKMAVLFVLGCVLLALLAPRMERIRVELASRPMRSFAMGLVGTLVGSIIAVVSLGVLCLTVVGIPLAVIAVIALALAVYGAIASVLTTFGAAVIGHKTQNPYLHLLLGCGAFLVLSTIPYVGGLTAFAVTMLAIGALVSTRAGGLLEPKKRLPAYFAT